MIKQWLLISMLFTGTVNADIFKALKDAATKTVEAQKQLKSPNEGSGTSSDQQSEPQFNSLIEEAAYKKQQEEAKVANSNKYKNELKNTVISRIQRLRTSESSFYQKYLVKQNDTQEVIDIKFKNKDKLFKNMQKDFATLDTEREDLLDTIDRNSLNNVISEHLNEKSWNRHELNSIFSNASESYPDGYVIECSNLEPYIEIERNKLIGSYQEYLKCAFFTYQKRQEDAKDAKANELRQAQEQQEKVKAQKELEIRVAQDKQKQQIQLVNEQKERQKVQGACQAWRLKANKGVYSLGVGDQVMSRGSAVYVIQGVNANTFLVNSRLGAMYLQKSDLIPYNSLNTAPSEYCYR